MRLKEVQIKAQLCRLPKGYTGVAEIGLRNDSAPEPIYSVSVMITDTEGDTHSFPYVFNVEPVRTGFQLHPGLFGPAPLRRWLINTFGEEGIRTLNNISNEVTDAVGEAVINDLDYTPMYIGTGFEVQARVYMYAGAPAYELYIQVGTREFGPVAYYDHTDGGLTVEYIDIGLVDTASAAAYRAVYGDLPKDGAGDFEMLAIKAEMFECIEQGLLSECNSVTPEFITYLEAPAAFENERWYISADMYGGVYVNHLPTGADTHDGFRLIWTGKGGIAITESARSWISYDPLWGYQPTGNPNTLKADLSAELDDVFEQAIKQWKGEGKIQ